MSNRKNNNNISWGVRRKSTFELRVELLENVWQSRKCVVRLVAANAPTHAPPFVGQVQQWRRLRSECSSDWILRVWASQKHHNNFIISKECLNSPPIAATTFTSAGRSLWTLSGTICEGDTSVQGNVSCPLSQQTHKQNEFRNDTQTDETAHESNRHMVMVHTTLLSPYGQHGDRHSRNHSEKANHEKTVKHWTKILKSNPICSVVRSKTKKIIMMNESHDTQYSSQSVNASDGSFDE